MEWTAEKITNASDTWANFNGFSGEVCGFCGAAANVLAGGPGWECGCTHYNCQHWHHNHMPHKLPMYGPPAEVIREGIENSKWYKEVSSSLM